MYTFNGGIPEWRSFNYSLQQHEEYRKIPVRKIPPQELAMLLEHEKDMYILDVRPLGEQCLTITPQNFSLNNTLIGGPFIAGTQYCPLVYLEEHYTEIPPDAKIIISDWVMKQASFAAKFLVSRGYNVVGILKGGVKRWQAEGMQVQEPQMDSDESIFCN